MVFFQLQPTGAAAVFRPVVLEFTYVERPHGTHSALPDRKIAAAERMFMIENAP